MTYKSSSAIRVRNHLVPDTFALLARLAVTTIAAQPIFRPTPNLRANAQSSGQRPIFGPTPNLRANAQSSKIVELSKGQELTGSKKHANHSGNGRRERILSSPIRSRVRVAEK